MRDHARLQAKRLWPWSKGKGPRVRWLVAKASAQSTVNANDVGTETGTGIGDGSGNGGWGGQDGVSEGMQPRRGR